MARRALTLVSTALTALALAGAAFAASDGGPIVKTEAGLIAGRTAEGVDSFLGAPFAAPPVGPNRWRGPQPLASWTGVRPAQAFAPACLQRRPPGALGPEPSEDCLYLNVWTPAGVKPGAKLPVLVWIYGGAFRGGTTNDPRILGDQLARKGVVVVTIAYRTGALGFLSHPDLTAESPRKVSGNYGLLDQIAALKWVRRNIAAFGGDPAKVTLSGQSAGAISATMLAGSPDAKGLFRAVISMSGGSFAPPRSPAEAGENMETLARAEVSGVRFAERLGAKTLPALRALPGEAILAADNTGSGWPVVDGQVIPGDQYRLFERGGMADVPLLLGSTANEGFNFSRVRTLDEFRQQVRKRYGRFADDVLAAYPAATDAEAAASDRALLREVMFGWGTWTWARLQDRHGHAPAYVYYFDHTPPPTPDRPASAGAYHGADVPYPFGVTHMARDWTPADLTLSAAFQDYYVNFIKTGDPNGPGLPAWPRFRQGDQQVLHVTDSLIPGLAPHRAELDLIDRYMAARRAAGTEGPPQ